MKKTLILFAFLVLTAAASGQRITHFMGTSFPESGTSARSVALVDGDRIADSVYYDFGKRFLVIRLSGRDFEPVTAEYEWESGELSWLIFEAGTGGLYCSYESKKLTESFTFDYEEVSEKFRLKEIFGAYRGPIYYSHNFLNLSTGEFRGSGYYSDPRSGEFSELPETETLWSVPVVYLSEESDFDFGTLCNELFESLKIQQWHTVVTVALNDSLSVRTHSLTREEYTARKEASGHPREPLAMISCTDVPRDEDHLTIPASTPFVEEAVDRQEIERRLGGRLKFIGIAHEYESDGQTVYEHHYEYDITYNDGTKRHLDGESGFIAWFPGLETLFFDTNGGDTVIELNDSTTDYGLNPLMRAVSPDGRWRINGSSPDHIAIEGYGYYLEKWNEAKQTYEFAAVLFGGQPNYGIEWSWVDNDTLLTKDTGYYNDKEDYQEWTIVEN
jgi:hypothetical protein